MKTPQERRIEERIKVKDAREDAKQRSITVSWSINAAIQHRGLTMNAEKTLEETAREMLRLFDKLFEERSQEKARQYEVEDEAMNGAEQDAGNF